MIDKHRRRNKLGAAADGVRTGSGSDWVARLLIAECESYVSAPAGPRCLLCNRATQSLPLPVLTPASYGPGPTARLIASFDATANPFCRYRLYGYPSFTRICAGRENATMSYQTSPDSRSNSTVNLSSPISACSVSVP